MGWNGCALFRLYALELTTDPKIVSGDPEQTLKIKMDAESDRLYRNKMDAIEKQAETQEVRQKLKVCLG